MDRQECDVDEIDGYLLTFNGLTRAHIHLLQESSSGSRMRGSSLPSAPYHPSHVSFHIQPVAAPSQARWPHENVSSKRWPLLNPGKSRVTKPRHFAVV